MSFEFLSIYPVMSFSKITDRNTVGVSNGAVFFLTVRALPIASVMTESMPSLCLTPQVMSTEPSPDLESGKNLFFYHVGFQVY